MGKDGYNDNRAKRFVHKEGDVTRARLCFGVWDALTWGDLFPIDPLNPHRPSPLDGCHTVLRKQSQ